MFMNLKVSTKLIVLVLIPIITLFIFALLILNEKYKSVKNAQLLENGILLSNKISLIIHELQKERGSSSGFIGSKGDEKFKQILDTQRKLSDDKIKDFSDFLDSVDMGSYGENLLASINNAKKSLKI